MNKSVYRHARFRASGEVATFRADLATYSSVIASSPPKVIASNTTGTTFSFATGQLIGALLGRCDFYARKQLCFQRVLAIAILSVRLSVTRVDQAKTVQARISKFSPSAAWKTLVSGTVKLFRKLEGGHPERGC